MYEPIKWINDWQLKSLEWKKRKLEEYSKKDDEITDILLRDSLYPFWGVIEGRLRDKYERISAHEVDDALTILSEETGVPICTFYGRN